MKTKILIILSLIASTVASTAETAKSIEGFMEIRWGTAPEEAKQIMSANPGTKFDRVDGGAFVYHGGTFAGRPVNAFRLLFAGNRFYEGDVYLDAGDRKALHEALKRDLAAKYGPPTATGKVTRWVFPANAFHKESQVIEISEWKENQLRVSYINETVRGTAGNPKEGL